MNPTPSWATSDLGRMQAEHGEARLLGGWASEAARALLAGVAGACAFPLVLPGSGAVPLLDSFPREALIFLAALLLFRIVDGEASLHRRMALTYLAGLAHFAVLLYWLDIAMVRFGGMPQWQAVPAIALLVAYCAGYWGLLPILYDWLIGRARGQGREGRPLRAGPRRRALVGGLAFAVALVTTEWVRTVALTGFPWGLWGYSQARNLVLAHLAQLGGVYVVSFAIALLGALMWQYLCARHTPRAGFVGGGLLLSATVLLATGAALHWRAVARAGHAGAETVRVGVLQGNIAQDIKNQGYRHALEIQQTYGQLAQSALGAGAQVLVWPEAALPGHLEVTATQLPLTLESVPQLIGVATYVPDTEPIQMHNSAVWVSVHEQEREREREREREQEREWEQERVHEQERVQEIEGLYHKRHMVPFGEYVPMGWLLPVERFVPGWADYGPGDDATPLGDPRVGVLICYDGVFGALARASVLSGARVLANLTNDGWYGVSSGPYQHLDFYVLRAIETGRWVVRAANTGISGFVDPVGRLHAATRLGERGMTVQDVVLQDGLTIYMRVGDAFAFACVIWVAAAAPWRTAARALRRRRWWGRGAG